MLTQGADVGTPVLEGTNLTLTRGRRRIHDGLDISFRQGITALLGPNGAGKTTLIEGLLRPTRVGGGTVSLDGEEVPAHLSEAGFLGRVGHMPQHWRFYSSFTVQESIEYVAWLKKVPRGLISQATHDALAATDMVENRRTKIRTLSGGMRQRVGLAEAFVNDPRVVLLDEPTVGLDPAQRASFRRYVLAKASARAIVLSTHLTEDVESMADRVIVLGAGKVRFDGSPQDLAEIGGRESGSPSIESGYLALVDLAPDAGAS